VVGVNNRIRQKEEELEGLKVDREIAGTRAEIAARNAEERRMKKVEGKDWRKIMGGIFRSVKVNREAMESTFGVNPDLRKMSDPRSFRRYK
jgi:hypothetical protein